MRPTCYNRAPYAESRTRTGIAEDGEWVTVELRNDWFEDRCRVWDGVGIGALTPEYPRGTPYPVAHGWGCTGCRWRPGVA